MSRRKEKPCECEDIDLNDHLTPRGGEHYFLNVRGKPKMFGGTEMREGDEVIIDSSLKPLPGDVVAKGDRPGDLVIGTYNPRRHLKLVGDEREDDAPEDIFGVVTFLIRPMRAGKGGNE